MDTEIYQLFLPTYVNLTFILMLGFYILLRAFGIPAWLAGLGGIMWAFSSYFFILISAGHIWKFITLAYIPPTIAGIVLAYRGKLLAGGILTAFFIALQIMSNHVQMSYYFLFVILFIAGAYFEDAWRNKTLPRFFKASAVLLVAALIGVAANLSNLYHTYTYSKETMRGKSELVQTGDAAKQTSSGLDRDYITNWELWHRRNLDAPRSQLQRRFLLRPPQPERNRHGKGQPDVRESIQLIPTVLRQPALDRRPRLCGCIRTVPLRTGLLHRKRPAEMGVAGSNLLLHRPGMGQELHAADGLLHRLRPDVQQVPRRIIHPRHSGIHHSPAGNLCLKRVLEEPGIWKANKKAFGISLALTAGVALLLTVAPGSLGSGFVPAQEAQMLQNAVDQQMIPANELSGILANLSEMRGALVSADALRSFIIICIGCALLWLHSAGKLRQSLTVAGITVLCLVDMWSVNKRYLHDEQFVPRSIQTETFSKTRPTNSSCRTKARTTAY